MNQRPASAVAAGVRTQISSRSSCPLFVLIEQFAQFREFFLGRLMGGKRAHHQAARGAVEAALQKVARQLALRPFARFGGLVDVRALLLIAAHQALLRHDLHGLEHGGVLRGFALRNHVVNVADGNRAAAPQDGEDLEFRFGRLGQVSSIYEDYYYDELRIAKRVGSIAGLCTRRSR